MNKQSNSGIAIGNINGDHNHIDTIKIQNKEPLISDDYCLKDYSLRKKDMGMTFQYISLILGLLIDLITFANLLKTSMQPLISLIKKNRIIYDEVKFLILLLLFILITYLLSKQYNKTNSLRKTGIYKSYYYLDKNVYKLIPKKCPKCHAKIQIKNSEGNITFHCPRSNNHSKTIDITELDNLPLIE